MQGTTSPEANGKYQYTIEYLARLAMSPLCLVPPIDWERINTDYPGLVRKVAFMTNRSDICDAWCNFDSLQVVELFDAKSYLHDRSDVNTELSVQSVDEMDPSEV